MVLLKNSNMFKAIFTTKTWKDSQITVPATIINGSLGALFYILMARFLGPADFGLLTVAVVTLTMIADVVDFGTNTGLVRFVSANAYKNPEKALKFLKLSLEFKIAIWFVSLVVGLLLAPLIATDIFKKVDLVGPLRLVMVGVGGALLISFASSSLQAFQKYFIWGVVNISINLLRLVVITLLFLSGQFNLFNGLLSYILLPFFGFSLALLFLPSKQMFKVRKEFAVAKQLFKYNFWVGVFTIIAALSARLDTFLSARLLSNFDLGIYGAANQLVAIVPQLVSALGMVAAPKFASFVNTKDMIAYLKKFQLFVLGISLVGLLMIPFSIYLIPLVFGLAYQTTVLPFIILLIAMLIFLISVPIHNSIIFYFGKPDVFVWISLGHLIIVGVLGYILISSFGIIGAATTVLIGTSFNFLAPLIWFLMRLRK